jgi:hypothetical protein
MKKINTVHDILKIPKSDERHFSRVEWVHSFFDDPEWWRYGVRGEANGYCFVLIMNCDYECAKEIASDERRLFEYIKLVERKLYKRLFCTKNEKE